MSFKRQVFLMLPKKHRSKAKYFYYGKVVHTIDNLKHKIYYGEPELFNSIALETTTYCNLRCTFCPNSKFDRGLKENEKRMPEEIFEKIINELAKMGYRGKVLLFSYGEPTADDRIVDWVKYSHEKLPKAKVEINSNGFLLTPELYKKLVDAGIHSINVTQYGKIMPPNIKKIYQYLKENPSIKKVMTYRILNHEELSNRGGDIELESSVNFEAPICIYPTNALTIDYKGNLVLCCNDYHGKYSFGNLGKDTLLNILKNSRYRKILEEVRNKKFNLDICKKCVGITK